MSIINISSEVPVLLLFFQEVEMSHVHIFFVCQTLYSRVPRKNLQIKSFIMNLAKEIGINIRTCKESFPSVLPSGEIYPDDSVTTLLFHCLSVAG